MGRLGRITRWGGEVGRGGAVVPSDAREARAPPLHAARARAYRHGPVCAEVGEVWEGLRCVASSGAGRWWSEGVGERTHASLRMRSPPLRVAPMRSHATRRSSLPLVSCARRLAAHVVRTRAPACPHADGGGSNHHTNLPHTAFSAQPPSHSRTMTAANAAHSGRCGVGARRRCDAPARRSGGKSRDQRSAVAPVVRAPRGRGGDRARVQQLDLCRVVVGAGSAHETRAALAARRIQCAAVLMRRRRA